MKNKGTLFIVSGPSGAGKGTVVEEIIKAAPEKRLRIYLSVSMTSRSIRGNEIDGQSYFFVTRDDFLKAIEDGELIEYNEFSGNFYGTPKKNVEDHINSGENVILEIDVNGGDQVVRQFPDAVRVFIMPPSLAVLEQRIRDRGRDSDEDIRRRLGEAEREIRKAADYDYMIVNDDLSAATDEFLSIIAAEGRRTAKNKEIINEVLGTNE